MDGGFPFARFSAALCLSLSAHLLIAWSFAALHGAPGEQDGSAASGALQVALRDAEVVVAQAPATSRSAAATRYLSATDLDVRPQIMTHVMPRYPAELVSGVRGRVVLELYISKEGALERIRVAQAEPPGRFEQSALEAFRAARFAPGVKNGKPVPSLMRIEVTFGD